MCHLFCHDLFGKNLDKTGPHLDVVDASGDEVEVANPCLFD